MAKLIWFVVVLSIGLPAQEATYVGETSCMECHSGEVHAWEGSHHDLAMQVANEKSVLADFNNTSFTYNGIITKFYKKDGKYMVTADGPDGKMQDYEISYTFGVYPLQQYMIKFPDGKVQVLDPTWDARPKEEGGQRWYHIHQDENVTAGDPLHWTGPNMNWNYMCADCHSTNLKKNYDAQTKAYHTTWSSINVSCESCHGPASNHLEWTRNQELNVTNRGFPVTFSTPKQAWREKSATLKAFIQERELNVCAKCHSRRSQLDDNFVPGDNFHDHYLPVKLDNGLYFHDGKIDDEVYVYNSFLQSKMYAEGVTCTDCHDPHSLERKGVGDQVCFSCHQSETYTATSHHKHQEGSTGSSCISCHMPARTYMGVDSRNDHSFRVPRPDISVASKEIPNACNLCHTDKDPSWSVDAMKKWYGKVPTGYQNFSHALHALRSNAPDAPKSLYDVLKSDTTTLVKATVAEYLGNYPSKQTYVTTLQMLRHSDPIIRRSALVALESFPLQMRLKETVKMLEDPMKVVRIEAARQMMSIPMGDLDERGKKLYEKVLTEYYNTLMFTAERPETQISLARFHEIKGDLDKAKQAYEEVLRLQPQFVPGYINYSHFLKNQGNEQAAKEILEQGIKILPDIGILHHTLGLWYVRAKIYDAAEKSLKKATELEDTSARFAYVYAVAVGEKNPQKAIKILEKAHKVHQGDISIVSALAYYYKMIGESEKSKVYEKRAQDLQNFSVH